MDPTDGADASADTDGDGVSDGDEILAGTSVIQLTQMEMELMIKKKYQREQIQRTQTDGDETDGQEKAAGTDATDAKFLDTDNDG